jgi:transposase, IS30 family
VFMEKKYKRLSYEERLIIWYERNKGLSLREIGIILNRPASTIQRELSRNRNEGKTAQEQSLIANNLSIKRISQGNSHYKIQESAKKFIRELIIKTKSSPYLISGRMKLEVRSDRVCKDTIYHWIRKSAKDLIFYLPRYGQKRTRCDGGRKRKLIPLHISKTHISQRAKVESIGHLEGDTMHGIKGKSVLSVYIDKISRLVVISKITTTSKDDFLYSTKLALTKFSNLQSLTLDNGPECQCYPELQNLIPVYFATPYHSWEKGAVENRIQVIRNFIPKGSDLDLFSDDQISQIEQAINSRPMACLGFKTPYESHALEIKKLIH